jgi:hypothetical protein
MIFYMLQHGRKWKVTLPNKAFNLTLPGNIILAAQEFSLHLFHWRLSYTGTLSAKTMKFNHPERGCSREIISMQRRIILFFGKPAHIKQMGWRGGRDAAPTRTYYIE